MTKQDRYFKKWETVEEINFIKSLNKVLFEGYKKALPLRNKWGKICKHSVKKFVKNWKGAKDA